MNPGRSLPLLTISILLVLLQPRISSILPALALRGLHETWQLHDSNATTDLPDPAANCDPPQTTQMGTFFANSTSEEQLHGADHAVLRPPLATNFSETQNSTHEPCTILNGNVSDCGNASSTTEHKIPHKQNLQAADMKSYMVVHADEVASAHVDEDSPLYEIASMHVVVNGKDDVLFVNKEGSTSTPIHVTDSSSVVTDSVQVMVINDDDVVLVDDAQQRNITTAPATHVRAQATPQSSLAKDSVQIMEVDKDDVVFISAEQLGGPTPPPGSSSIHTAAGSSIAREAVQVMDLGKGDVLWINEEQLAGSTSPPGDDPSIHTAAQSSVARDSVQVMVIDEDDVVLANAEQLGRYTPPPIDTSIHTAGQRLAARESMQVIKMSEGGVKEERLGASTPPPGGSDINTASQSSVARDSSFHVSFQHGKSQHDQS